MSFWGTDLSLAPCSFIITDLSVPVQLWTDLSCRWFGQEGGALLILQTTFTVIWTTLVALTGSGTAAISIRTIKKHNP